MKQQGIYAIRRMNINGKTIAFIPRLHRIVRGIKNGLSIAQDIAKGYNCFAQWVCLPNVPTPFLKKDGKGWQLLLKIKGILNAIFKRS